MDIRKRILTKNKTIATGLMIGAALLFIVARSRPAGGGWEWLAAFAEAAMVGALADWFAVVAIFRHPLGLPIPHTAIIKHKQDAIAGNLADFIRDKFLAPETLREKLRAYNPAEHLAAYLISPTNAEGLAHGVARILSESLDFLDDERVHNLLRAGISNRIESFDLSSTVATLLTTLRNGDRHQAVLDDALNRCAVWLSSPQAQTRLATSIDDMITKEYPLISHFIPNRDQFSKGAGEKIVKRINTYIQEVNSDPVHEFRQKFDTIVTECISRLHADEVLRTKIETLKLEAVRNPFLAEYAENLGREIKSWLCSDLNQPHSKIKGKLAAVIAGLGSTLSTNRELKDSFNEHLEKLVHTYGDTVRSAIARHISATVKMWEHEEYVNEIELSIGSDLQFIRMNGTLVGGIIGLLLHAVGLLLN